MLHFHEIHEHQPQDARELIGKQRCQKAASLDSLARFGRLRAEHRNVRLSVARLAARQTVNDSR